MLTTTINNIIPTRVLKMFSATVIPMVSPTLKAFLKSIVSRTDSITTDEAKKITNATGKGKKSGRIKRVSGTVIRFTAIT